jgi:Flp pilus assembly protein TadD
MQKDPTARTQAVAAYRSGKPAEAVRLCRQIVEADPQDAEIWCVLGVAQHALGEAAEAEASHRQAIRLRPAFVDAWNNLGNTLVTQGKLEEAVATFQEAIRLRPGYPEAHNNLGAALRHQGKWPEAVEHYRQALRLRPDYPDALNNLGDALQCIGQFEEARASYEHALQLRPGYPEARTNLGNVLTRLARHDEAIAQHKEALRLRPGYADAHCNLGNALSAQHRYAEAELCYRECLRLKPAYSLAYHNLGTALGEQGRLAEAEECYREAVHLKADSMDALGNLATILLDQGKAEEATTVCARILEYKPDSPDAHLSRALALLAIGRWQEAWPDYEWRWRTADFGGRMPYEQPLWDGSSLEGRTVLVHAEQGLGDTFLFVRFLPLVKQRGGTVVFACPKVLLRLLRGFPGVNRLVEQGTEMPPFDCQAPLMSLPAVFDVTPETVPANIPYLTADPGLVDYWQRELPANWKFRIGIAWQGNPGFKADRRRSMRLAEFAPLAAVEGVELYSLQKGFGSEQIRDASFPIVDLAPRLDQSTGAFVDTAAVIKNLDLVIATDTALVHLAGAMGAPAWLAQSYAPHWVWLRGRDDSPWYPSVRLFRQERWGDWKGVFARMAAALQQEVAAPRRPRPILLETTPGELIDRISIYRLRSERLKDVAERSEAERQLAALEAARDRALQPSAELSRLAEELKSANAMIWDAQDEMRQREVVEDLGDRYVELARLVSRGNERREALKREIDCGGSVAPRT